MSSIDLILTILPVSDEAVDDEVDGAVQDEEEMVEVGDDHHPGRVDWNQVPLIAEENDLGDMNLAERSEREETYLA